MRIRNCSLLSCALLFPFRGLDCHATDNRKLQQSNGMNSPTPAPSSPLLGADPDLLFVTLDRDGNGHIDLDEFNALFGIVPSETPSSSPSLGPSPSPSDTPTASAFPSQGPSSAPSTSFYPSGFPTEHPSVSIEPSSRPSTSQVPSRAPTPSPSGVPSAGPTAYPSDQPTVSTGPSLSPTQSNHPSSTPSSRPSSWPSSQPSSLPTQMPTKLLSSMPSAGPTRAKTIVPTQSPTISPSSVKTEAPSTAEKTSYPSVVATTSIPNGSEVPTPAPSKKVTAGFPSKTSSPTGNLKVEIEPSYAPSSSLEPSMAAITGQILAIANVTIPTVDGLMNDQEKLVFEETALLLLIDRYPRLTSYDIDFLFVQVEGQLFQYDKGDDKRRRLQENALVGDLTVVLRVASKIFPAVPTGFDFQTSVESFFEVHKDLLVTRLNDAGIVFDPKAILEPTQKQENKSGPKSDEASLADIFSPGVIVGIALAMAVVIIVGAFIMSRPMWHVSRPEDYPMESPTGRLGAAPSYDSEDLDPETILLSLSEISRNQERQKIAASTGPRSVASHHTGRSTATGSLLAGLNIPHASSADSVDSGACVTSSPGKHKRGENSLKNNRKPRFHSRDCGVIRNRSMNILDECSTSTTPKYEENIELQYSKTSDARQRKRRLENHLLRSKNPSDGSGTQLMGSLQEDEELCDDAYNSSASKAKRIVDMNQMELGEHIPVSSSFQDAPKIYERLSDVSGTILEVVAEDVAQDSSIEKGNDKAPSRWFWLGQEKTSSAGEPPLARSIFGARSNAAGRTAGKHFKNASRLDEGEDDDAEKILLDHIGSSDGDHHSSSSGSAGRRSRPPRLNLRKIDTEDRDDSSTPKAEEAVETPLADFPIPSSVVNVSSSAQSVDPDGHSTVNHRRYRGTTRGQERGFRPLPSHSRREPSHATSNNRYADPPTRRAILAEKRERVRRGTTQDPVPTR